MGAFANALTELAGLSVSGVRNNYGIDAVPDDLSRAQLPALLTLPLAQPSIGDRIKQQNRVLPDRGEGFETLAFSSGLRSVSYRVTHLLLSAPVSNGKGIRSSLPTLVDLIDAYFAALGEVVTLNGMLMQPPVVRVEAGIFQHGSTEYYGCAFRHTWLVRSDLS